MSTLNQRLRLVSTARLEAGTLESARNSGKRVKEYQASTTLSGTGWPWCAAFVCWCIREWGKDPEVLALLKKTPAQFEKWRPKTASAFGLIDWARKQGLEILSDSQKNQLRSGDIMIFDMSHAAIVVTDEKTKVLTIEGNTGPSGGRDGDGVWEKSRERSMARCFIRLLPP